MPRIVKTHMQSKLVVSRGLIERPPTLFKNSDVKAKRKQRGRNVATVPAGADDRYFMAHGGKRSRMFDIGIRNMASCLLRVPLPVAMTRETGRARRSSRRYRSD